MGLDPTTPGSRPEPKADALMTALPRRPSTFYSNSYSTFCPYEFSFFFFFFFFKFIYSTEIETASERGNTAGGVGEEEAGSQWRSLMWGSIP